MYLVGEGMIYFPYINLLREGIPTLNGQSRSIILSTVEMGGVGRICVECALFAVSV